MTAPDRPVQDWLARVLCDAIVETPLDEPCAGCKVQAAAVVAACREATARQQAELTGDRYRPGPLDRITRDDALPPSGPPPKGTLDEVVLTNVTVHLERMDDGWYWLGLTKGPRAESLRMALGIGLRPGRKRAVHAWVSDEDGTDLHLIPERTDEARS